MIKGKIGGEERRNFILRWLKDSNEPLTGQFLAEKTNVSRQVIVQDISLLKAKNEPIIATSSGYIYLNENGATYPYKKIIACHHLPQNSKEELLILVDHGIFVRDVIIEHSIYGELTASLMIKNRRDVNEFINKMERTNASYLSDLTDGVHLHTVEAETLEQLNDAVNALQDAGFLLQNENNH